MPTGALNDRTAPAACRRSIPIPRRILVFCIRQPLLVRRKSARTREDEPLSAPQEYSSTAQRIQYLVRIYILGLAVRASLSFLSLPYSQHNADNTHVRVVLFIMKHVMVKSLCPPPAGSLSFGSLFCSQCGLLQIILRRRGEREAGEAPTNFRRSCRMIVGKFQIPE